MDLPQSIEWLLHDRADIRCIHDEQTERDYIVVRVRHDDVSLTVRVRVEDHKHAEAVTNAANIAHAAVQAIPLPF